MITQVNIYRSNGQWCYAALTIEGHDHSDTLDVPRNATARQAERAAECAFPNARITRVDDVGPAVKCILATGPL